MQKRDSRRRTQTRPTRTTGEEGNPSTRQRAPTTTTTPSHQRHQREHRTNQGATMSDRESLNHAFGKYVADSRRRNFYSQRHLADRMNDQFGYAWHQTVVSKIENGERHLTAEELFHLAVIFKHYEIADRSEERRVGKEDDEPRATVHTK